MKIISKNYQDEQKTLHKNPNYGVASLSFAPMVAEIMKRNNLSSLSDYGAGKLRLLEGLKKQNLENFSYFPFDPAFPDYGEPKRAEMVCCIDVLEHVEPEYIAPTLKNLAKITEKVGFFSIHIGAAGKTLSDGRNAHLTQQPTSWWLPKLCRHFNIVQLKQHKLHGNGFRVIVVPITTGQPERQNVRKE